MAADSRRLSILSAQEVDELYGLPRFTGEDHRRLYFDLGPAERELVDGVFTFSVAVHLVLQLGYFKAKRQFFVYSLDSVAEDTAHIVMASLAQKDVTQATVVRKLSSYARQNQTKKALWELDNIRRTLYILDFVDDPTLRQSVQKALNRGESYHRMRRAISYVNSGKFRVKTEAEQQVWNECSRLIANAIIYYNTLLLSRVYEQKAGADDLEAIKILKKTSPVAWRNINLIGNFDFTIEPSPVDMEALAACYQNEDFWLRSLQEADDDRSE